MSGQKRLWRIDNDELVLSFHAGQIAAHDSAARFVFVISGTQGGKTSYGPWWLWNEISRLGSGDYLAVTASYDLFKLKMLPEIRSVFEDVTGWGRYWSGDKVIELKNPDTGKFESDSSSGPMWGRIILRSASAPGGLEAATAKSAWLDECGQDGFTLEAWEAVLRRLSLSQGRVLGTTTPYNLGWLKTSVYDAWANGDTDFDVIQFSSIINPEFPVAEFERAKKSMQDWRFTMFYEGKFAKPAGLIYGCFDDGMLVDGFDIPPDWSRIIGVDFGGANTALVYMAQSPDGIWYAYDESLSGGKSTSEHVAGAVRSLDGEVDSIDVYGGSGSEGQYRLDWRASGLDVREPPGVGVEGGIDRVTALIKSGRFRVFRTMRGLRDELGSYSRKLDSAFNPTDEIADKRLYHRLDALRYAVCGMSQSKFVKAYHGMV